MVEPAANRLIAVSHLVASGADDRAVRKEHHRGAMVRVRRGAYSDAAEWSASDAGARYDLRIAAALVTRRSDVVLSHHSAARIWGLPLIDWPTAVHITEPAASSKRTKNGVFVHRRELPPSAITAVDGIRVTTLIETLLDLACDATFRDAVCALDFAQAPPGGGIQMAELLQWLEARESRREARALRALSFSTPLAMSPLESFSRVVLHELGFPPPELQMAFRTRSGVRFADFWWEQERVLGECDGRAKYVHERYTAGRSAADILWEEKRREIELSDTGARLVRWTWSDCLAPDGLAARLRAVGLRQARTAPRVPRR